MANKQIPALPPLDEAPADDDRFVLRDTSSGSDKSLRVDRFLERSGEQVSEHATETGGIHGIPEDERALHTGDDSDALSDIPEGERAINSEELLSSVSEAADIDEAVSFVGKGAIVESGSNANGHYVRWENGEQVCWASIAIGDFIDVGSGTSRSIEVASLPASFSGNSASVSSFFSIASFGSTATQRLLKDCNGRGNISEFRMFYIEDVSSNSDWDGPEDENEIQFYSWGFWK